MSALCIFFFLQEKRKGIGEGDTGREFLLDIGRSGEGSYREWLRDMPCQLPLSPDGRVRRCPTLR